MIVGTSDHNHHDRSYAIQLTSNGRCITHNRQYIKPTSITVDTYLQYIATKQHCTRTNPLADILNGINKTPAAHVNVQTNSSDNKSRQYEQHPSQKQKGEAQDKEHSKAVTNNEQRQEKTSAPIDKRVLSCDSRIIKTKSGQIIKTPDRLAYV